jgi:alcohol dehydrogenase
MIQPFSIARLPRIEFGRGSFARTVDLISRYGNRVLLVTGARSFENTPCWDRLLRDLEHRGIGWERCKVAQEPSPMLVDEFVARLCSDSFSVVLGIGGGSALDAAKAIAGLLRVNRSVMDYLEGVGPELPYEGPAVPFIAVPTTAGTGSEATKNAVLSVHGKEGFKKSFRDERLVAEYAIVDPELLASCPPQVIAANGMDALTQLIESYVSIRSNTYTEALGTGAMSLIRDSLPTWYENGADTADARSNMAYASLISGINLAQTGLGSVHGLASPLGAFFPVPHGVVCGTLVAEATEMNIRCMLAREPDNPALAKYARLGEILCGNRFKSRESAWKALVEFLSDLTQRFKLPGLCDYGLKASGLDRIVAESRGSSMKTNPIVLSDDEIKTILTRRL